MSYSVTITSGYYETMIANQINLENRVIDLERELAETRKRADGLRSKLETVRKDADDLRVELLMSNMTIATLVECCASLENKIASAAEALK